MNLYSQHYLDHVPGEFDPTKIKKITHCGLKFRQFFHFIKFTKSSKIKEHLHFGVWNFHGDDLKIYYNDSIILELDSTDFAIHHEGPDWYIISLPKRKEYRFYISFYERYDKYMLEYKEIYKHLNIPTKFYTFKMSPNANGREIVIYANHTKKTIWTIAEDGYEKGRQFIIGNYEIDYSLPEKYDQDDFMP